MKAHRILNSAIFAPLHLVYSDMIYAKMRGKQLPVRQGKIGHRLKGMGSLLPQPFVYLVPPESLGPVFRKKGTQRLTAQFSDIAFLGCIHFMTG
jgi:hypothetical protein